MNLPLVESYIADYEKRFAEISDQEIYKWRAVKQFQDNWDPEAGDFEKMLSVSLSKTGNLMGSGNYFPRRVIVDLAERNPLAVKSLFFDLFAEEDDVISRIKIFREKIKTIYAKEHPGLNNFQDHRAALVYLTLRYPETYFFYKYEMFKKFCKKIEYDYKPTPGVYSNISQFLFLCEIVREELVKNNNLIKLHKDRLGRDEYFDVKFNILTQDFIYAVTNYLTPELNSDHITQPRMTLHDIQLKPTKKGRKEIIFKGRYIDFGKRNERNKRIGDIGEQLVLWYEKSSCHPKYVAKITHSAKTDGDGLGFDILSFDEKGTPKFIEVKTTKGKAETPFYISYVELERSKKEGSNYYLYRLFNLDEKNMTADFIVRQGNLSELCIDATEYKVEVEISTDIKKVSA